jgi:(p)ppGpp synthase/HD superfamily hydrolase
MSTLEKAISIALEAHKGKVDKAGAPYILHPLRVMLQMDTDEEMIAAVLHDVLEDSEITFRRLRSEGFSEGVMEALDSVTKRAGESYEDFVRRAGSNRIGRKVKRADLQDNMNLSRLKEIREEDLKRVRKYHKALTILGELAKTEK